VGRARHGAVSKWGGSFARFQRLARRRTAARPPFASAARAQAWYEWRQHGWSLPAWVAIALPFELGLLFIDRGTPAFVWITLAAVTITPPIMAAFVATTVRSAGRRASDAPGVTPFMATRPLASAAMVAAKLRVAMWSTAAAWLVVIVAVPPALGLSDAWPVVLDRVHALRNIIGMPRTVALALLALWLLVTATWKRLVLSLYVGLSGRAWLIRTHVGVTLAVLVAIVPAVQWLSADTRLLWAMWDTVLWLPAVLAGLKMAAAAWIGVQLHRRALVSERTLIVGAASWLAAVLALYAALVWIAYSPHVPRYLLLVAAVLAIPLARLSAAPLALAWNRHR
jgi:hypothetical protein